MGPEEEHETLSDAAMTLRNDVRSLKGPLNDISMESTMREKSQVRKKKF